MAAVEKKMKGRWNINDCGHKSRNTSENYLETLLYCLRGQSLCMYLSISICDGGWCVEGRMVRS